MHTADLWFMFPLADSGGVDTNTIALYTMISALGVAIITGAFNYLSRGSTKETPSRAMRTVAKQHEAYERFLLLRGFDPRKIKTGYESDEEVDRAPAPSPAD